jgi:CIC family chloride channel protein
MPEHETSEASTTEGLPVAPSLSPGLASTAVEKHTSAVDRRVAYVSCAAVLLGGLASVIAQGLTRLIALITNVSFYGRFSSAWSSPLGNHLGLGVVVVPVVGALLVGVMARYGSPAIRGHGIPEAMEQVLFNESKIPARMLFLKPLSAAISIGTGGPFGAEGPIIATGGALGSLVGQVLRTTADERKVLLGAGAAAGMAATFGSPVSAVLLAVELLVFEYRPRSLIPIALASATATSLRVALMGGGPAFVVAALSEPRGGALAVYVALGAVMGILSVCVTRAVYAIEDGFAKLPVHWMWWPALGAVPVGVIGFFAPRTMGVGYDNIEAIIGGGLALGPLAALCGLKFVSWAFSLGSGTSGGTLAPLFTVGGGLGAIFGIGAAWLLPAAGVDPRMAAVVGMAAMFAGASRAMLASVVFAFEVTRQPSTLVPLLAGVSPAFLVSSLLMHTSIMTEKIARRGVRVPTEYTTDFLDQILVRDVMSRNVSSLPADQTLDAARGWIELAAEGSTHQGFPVVDPAGALLGVVTRRDLARATPPGTRIRDILRRSPVLAYETDSLRQIADRMMSQKIGRLPIVTRTQPHRVVGIVTRSDLIGAHRERLRRAGDAATTFRWRQEA